MSERRGLWELQCPMQIPARPGCVDQVPGANCNSFSRSFSFKYDIFWERRWGELDFVEISNTQRSRLANQKMIEIWTIPVSIADPIVRAGRHQKLITPIGIGSKAAAKIVVIESEPPF